MARLSAGLPASSLSASSNQGPISARIERLPFTRWHARVIAVIGTAHLFDAFDALTIAFVLPLLVVEWQLSPAQAGFVISVGFIGQMLGAVLMGAAAERFGRRRVLRYALFLLSIFSFLSAFAWSVGVFVLLRFFQGIGLGGEVPVAATYVNEICPARTRGRMVFALQAVFGLGSFLTAIAAVGIVSRFGWQGMFLLGSLPILLAAFLPRLIPESPRWLAERGDAALAARIIEAVERKAQARGHVLPDVPADYLPSDSSAGGLTELFRSGYSARTLTVWTLALSASTAGFGIITWMPTLYTTQYNFPVEQALRYGVATNVAGFVGVLIGTFLIDRIGRRPTFVIGFGASSIPLIYLSYAGLSAGPEVMMILSAASIGMLSFILAGIYVYAPEMYPTRMRASGAGAASACLRIGSIASPAAVGLILPLGGISAVFLLFAIASAVGATTMLRFGVETRGRTLEEISR